ncbi:Hypothetical protein HVR_LOCUS151 [uncultured virus]|nr:Hypothetical protein HVR_LOCUS151 [uncultured virus]
MADTLQTFNPQFQVQVVNFQITPYSDEIATAINILPEGDIYKIFNSGNTSDMLTAALYGIHKLEFQACNLVLLDSSRDLRSQASGILLDKKNINDSWVLKESIRICPKITKNMPQNQLSMNPKIVRSLVDVLVRDQLIFQKNINELAQYPNVFVLVVNGLYSGHIYAWNVTAGSSQVTNVIGIRSSLLQLFADQCGLRQRGVAPIFMNAIKEWATITNKSKTAYVRIIQPISPMPDILKGCGFTMMKPMKYIDDTKWLFDDLSLGNIPLTQGLIFRDYDYIIKITDSFNCPAPKYEYSEIL